MEGLVILLGEFLFSLFGGFLLLIGQILLLVVSGVVQVALCFFGHAARSESGNDQAREKSFLSNKEFHAGPKLKLTVRVLGLLAVVAMILAMLVNSVWFEPSFRWITGQVEKRTGIELSYSEVGGSYFSGKMELQDLEVRRTGDHELKYQFAVKSLSLELNPFRVLSKPTRINSLNINGIEGSVSRCRGAQKQDSSSSEVHSSEELEPRRSFEINALMISNGRIHYIDQVDEQEPLTINLVLNSMVSRPFRGDYAVFDVFFRSSANGLIAGRPFELTSIHLDGGRSTRWEVEGLPVSIPRHFIGGPFKCITNGLVDVDVSDYWRLGNDTDIDMKWAMTLRNVEAAVPDNLNGLEAALANAAVSFINDNGEELPLSFDLAINENEFKGATSLKASGLFGVVSESFLGEVASRLGKDKEELKSDLSSGIKKFQRFLDKKRKKAEQDIPN